MIRNKSISLVLAFLALTVGSVPVLFAETASTPPVKKTSTPAANNQNATVPAVVKSSCMACHGMHGISVNGGTFPNLAGQWKAYLVQQLQDFKSHKRADPQAAIMWGMVAPLTDGQIGKVAQYFSEQKPDTGHAYNEKLIAEGKKLYYGGIPSVNLPACMACHGATLQGIPPFFPMLAGQKRSYVKEQLNYFKSGARNNDPKGMMRYVASKLDKKQIAALAEFIRAQ